MRLAVALGLGVACGQGSGGNGQGDGGSGQGGGGGNASSITFELRNQASSSVYLDDLGGQSGPLPGAGEYPSYGRLWLTVRSPDGAPLQVNADGGRYCYCDNACSNSGSCFGGSLDPPWSCWMHGLAPGASVTQEWTGQALDSAERTCEGMSRVCFAPHAVAAGHYRVTACYSPSPGVTQPGRLSCPMHEDCPLAVSADFDWPSAAARVVLTITDESAGLDVPGETSRESGSDAGTTPPDDGAAADGV